MNLLSKPQWQVHSAVHAAYTCRGGGVSAPPFDSLNLSPGSGDSIDAVNQNRALLPLPSAPRWLKQVHGARVVRAEDAEPDVTEADGSFSFSSGVICAVAGADCLPVLLCTSSGEGVAAAHAGWRGLAAGVLENAVAALRARADGKLLAWIGPAISAPCYEVGEEVRNALCRDAEDAEHFRSAGGRMGKHHADLPALARRRLSDAGVDATLSGLCTFSRPDRFFSARRESPTGRGAAFIWTDAGGDR